ncbi:MAG: shikimate kinase [Ruminococcaceae bacterium]|nr:shikimate kinase [Oscillospiraceae bacterium]
MRCGLIGRTLSHSFSPQIHRELADYSYYLFELEENELEAFIKDSNSFDACNVTIPYKKAVMPYLDEISEEAEKIGSVNTILRREDGTLRGENTDYYGFSYLLHRGNISITGKKVAILGTGGASVTAYAVCSDLGAESITFVSRTGEVNYQNVYDVAADTEVVINCTPVGMYPHNEISPIELSRMPYVESVADMIYNPKKTKLLLDAQRLGINNVNGLSMLVSQAKRACELFLGCHIDDSEIDRVIRAVEQETQNIVLVGMPGCGKSTIAKLLSQKTGRALIDTDDLIVEYEGRSIPEIFATDGEEYFRGVEHRAAAEAGKQSGKIIATGGGIVTREDNYDSLCQNATVVFIKRDVSRLSRGGRPLSQNGDLEQMYQKRLPMYRQFCEVEVSNDTTPENCVRRILDAILEKG